MGIEEIRKLKNEPRQKKERKPLTKVAPKRTKELGKYTQLRSAFLVTHPLCEIRLPGCTVKATEVHHAAGRENEKLLEVKNFKAACHNCHHRVTVDSKEAIEKGHSKTRLRKTSKK